MGGAVTDAEEPRFRPGDRVRVLTGTPPRHIRTPAFIQGQTGVIEAFYRAFKNPESLAYGDSGPNMTLLYRVRFDQRTVWQDYQGCPNDKICVDIYQHWLEPA